MIRIQGLHKFYNKGRQNEIHVIDDISLELPERGMVAIFGKSGCGKTTLLNVIGGLDKFSEGTLTVDGEDITGNTDDVRNRYIGYIFQNYNLNKAESCFDNVADALRLCGMTDLAEIEIRVNAALANVGMEKYAKRTPDTLSGGQQQRIAIARAIVKNPRIILADEPTGNLDEANTVMIMDLLKAIAKDHLVLLVTHEANLVDYYCDTVIELRDGKVISTKDNDSANGFTARDKNDIYLGEFEKSEIKGVPAEIEYYGDVPDQPIKLKIVNNGGKIYVDFGASKVHIIDEFGEVKLREGVYSEKTNECADAGEIDMSKLPHVKGSSFGKLFTLKSAIKSGYSLNFNKRKYGKGVLRICMALFAAVVVLMSAVFGTAFRDLISANKSYNHNVFYVYTPNGEISSKLNNSVGKADTGIDYIRLTGRYPTGDEYVYFRTGSFESFEAYDYVNNFRTNAVYLGIDLAKDMKLTEGRKDNLSSGEILISTRVADDLIKKSTLGYIERHRDLIGLTSDMFTVDGTSPRIVGIVESNEPAIYMTDMDMAKYIRNMGAPSLTSLDSDFGIDVASGETILAVKTDRSDLPEIGETIKIQGRELKVKDIKHYYPTYDLWLKGNSIEKKDMETYFSDILKAESPELTEGTDEFKAAVVNLSTTRRFEYFDYYYSEADSFYRDYYFFEPNHTEVFLYVKKGVDVAKFTLLPETYYQASVYKEMYGKYPTNEELAAVADSIPLYINAVDEYRDLYEEELYMSTNHDYSTDFNINTYIVDSEDYISFSKQLGETHSSALDPRDYVSAYSADDGNVVETLSVERDVVESDKGYYGYRYYYTVIHSNNPAKTEAWLSSEFATLAAPDEYSAAMVTPDTVFEELMREKTADIVRNLVALVLLIVLMSVCMYFIMRSSLMIRIKEIGIYRAIGVSKKNIIFKFFIESAVFATLTVLLGYLLTSTFIALCLGMSSLVADVFYYPLWLAGAVLVILYTVSVFFGTLPVVSLLRKTPSEILAKYDI